MLKAYSKVLGGALIIAGTSIGAGMLGLPVATAEGGFFPSLLIYFICYLVMTITGLLYLEITLKLPEGSNIISMAKNYLGNHWKIVVWLVYLFLFYCLSVSYLSVGAKFFTAALGDKVPYVVGLMLFLGLFGSMVFKGVRWVDKANSVLMIGLLISYFAFVVIGFPYVDTTHFVYADASKALIALPVILVSFGYQATVPSLVQYMKRDVNKIRLSIVLGTTIALGVYLLWQYLVVGIIATEGVGGLIEAKKMGVSVVDTLKMCTQHPYLSVLGQLFGFFAITTSYLGVNLGLFDFIADGLSLAKKGLPKVLVASLTFLPPAIIVMLYPNVFLKALSYAGGFGGALLLVALPVVMVFMSRFVKKDPKSGYIFPITRIGLVMLLLFVMFDLVISFM